MQVSKYMVAFWLGLMIFGSCKQTVIQDEVYDNIIYEIDTLNVYSSNVEKTKQKSSVQFISILYAQLFQSSIPSSTLLQLDELALSVGDKGLVNQMVISDFIQDPQVIVPTDAQMRADVDQFVIDTYRRFLSRNPNEYEKYFLVSLIETDPGMNPELIYLGFMLSNEYWYY